MTLFYATSTLPSTPIRRRAIETLFFMNGSFYKNPSFFIALSSALP
ncbi:MAG: hypothetical protein ACI8WW_002781, partial [Oceanospirillaceae bacterium]